MLDKVKDCVQETAKNDEAASDSVKVVHLLVALPESRKRRVLAGEKEEGGELADTDCRGAVEVGEVVQAFKEEAEDDDGFVDDAEGDLAEGEMEDREGAEEDAVVERAKTASASVGETGGRSRERATH